MKDHPVASERLTMAALISAGILMLFVFLHPPFLATSFTTEYKTARLVFEGSILLLLAMYLLGKDAKIYVALLFIFCLYMVNVSISAEQLENGLSYFNKLAFLLLLANVLQRKGDLAQRLKKTWVWLWTCFSIIGIVGYLLVLSNALSPTILDSYGNYAYYHYPFIGNFFFISTELLLIPRYCGFLVEPVVLGLFCGFNMMIAKELIAKPKRRKQFIILNIAMGLLTMSHAFVIFLLLFVLLKIANRLISNKPVVIYLVIVGLTGISILLGLFSANVEDLLPYSSLHVRVQQYRNSIEFLTDASLSQLIFGSGIVPFHGAIGGGASAGIFDVLASRGIVLFCIWVTVLYRCARHVPGLFAYILFYSLVLDYWHFPLFILGLAIIASSGPLRYQGRIVVKSQSMIEAGAN